MDHVRLSYCYLDDGDMDAYRSLFAGAAGPGEHTRRTARPFRHLIHDVFGSGRRIAAIGRRRPAGADDHDGVPFVDVFTVADDGLLIDRTTFLFAPAARCCAGS